MITIHFYPSPQQITKLIQFGVATGVTPTYNTSTNKSKSHLYQFTFSVPCNKTAETSLFSAVSFYIQLVFVLHPNDPNVNLIPIGFTFPLHIP